MPDQSLLLAVRNHASQHPPEKLPLSLKLEIVSDTVNCRKTLIEAAECLNELIGRVEHLKPVYLDRIDERGRVINDYQRMSLAHSQFVQNTLKIEQEKFDQRRAKRVKSSTNIRRKKPNL